MDNEVVIKITANDDTTAGAASARAKMTALGNDINTQMAASGAKAGASLGDGVTQGADGKLRDARGRFVALGQDINSTLAAAGTSAGGGLAEGVYRSADGRLRDVSGRFVSLGQDIEKTLGDSGSKGGTSLGSNIASKASDLVGGMGAKWPTLIAAAVVLGSPLIAGAFAGVVAGGAIAAGAALQRNTPQIQNSWNGLVSSLKSSATQASSGMVAPISGALDSIRDDLANEAPAFHNLFTSAAADIPILTGGLEALVDNSLPGLQAMVANSQPIMKGLSDVMGDVGSGVSDVAGMIGSASGLIGQDLHDMGGDTKNVVDAFGTLLIAGAQLFHDMQPEIGGITKLLGYAADAAVLLSHGFDIQAGVTQLAEMKAGAMGAGQATNDAADATSSLSDGAQAIQGTMSQAQLTVNDYGTSLQALVKDYQDATAGAQYVETSHDQATITAGQAVQSWQQLQASVTSAGQAYEQSGQQVGAAEHSVEQASEAVDAARHSEEQATLAVGQAQKGYTESVYQEKQAQEAVTAARAAAEAQLVSLKLQAEDASTSALSAGDALFQATQNASKLGVNPGNARSVAHEKETTGNQPQVAAAIALVAAEDQVANAQNQSKTAQSALNTARAQGVAGNPQVLSAEHALGQSQDAVRQATQQVADAQYAQRQSTLQVANAEYSLQQASDAVSQSERAEAAAGKALTTARDAASRSIDQNTLAGAQNRKTIIGVYEAYVNSMGPGKAAAQMTENVGTKMGFTHGQIQNVIKSLNGLNGTNANFSITGTPTINLNDLNKTSAALGVPIAAGLGGHARLTGFAAGGSTSGLAWVGEYGPEVVNLPAGSTVIPHANSMGMLSRGEAPLPGFAAGGSVGSLGSPMSALQMNPGITAQWGILDSIGQSLHSFGGPPVKLPPAGHLDLSGLLGGGVAAGSGLRGSAASNERIVQSVWANMFGWKGSEWAATVPLLMQESGFNNIAQNPTSSAYGMFQFLNSTWGGYGIPKTSDPTLQSVAGGRYIKGRYGDPIGALGHERAFNWYAAGGPAGGRAGVGERGRELVRIPGAGGGSSGGGVAVALSLEVAAGADGAVATMVKYLLRTGQIRLKTVDGRQVVAT